MAESFKELECKLNLIPVSVNWNDSLPFDLIIEKYSDSTLKDKIVILAETVKKRYKDIKVNKLDLYKVGVLADSFDLRLAYFITGNNSIDLIFHDDLNTKDWMDQFKGEVCRRQFFNLIHSYRNFKPYNSLFSISTFYTLYSSNLPIQCNKVNTYIIGKEYIVVQYLNDYGNTEYRVIKPGFEFTEYIPTIKYNSDNFQCLQFEFDNKVFTGDCVKYLFDGVDREYGNIDDGEFHLDPKEGTVWKDGDCYQEYIPKFKKDQKTKVLFSIMVKDKKVILLDNAFIWVIPDNQFISLRSIKGLENLDTDIFSISTKEKGIMVSVEPGTMECVPTVVFQQFLTRNILNRII